MNADHRCLADVLEVDLNSAQRRAALDPSHTLLCLACAGSGKSRTLAYRIARLVSEGVDPGSIVAITFTEKAAESIKQRVSGALARAGQDPRVITAMYIGTIHAFCLEILKKIDAKYNQFDVLDPNRLRLLLMNHYGTLRLGQLQNLYRTKYFQTINEVANALYVTNGEMVDVSCVSQGSPPLGRTLQELRQVMDREQFVDFSSMPRLVVEALGKQESKAQKAVEHVRHLMIDEYQDVEPSLEALIEILGARAETLFCVGDDDQAIYAWKGADVNNILCFNQKHPNASRHTLSVNYRSTEPIVTAADRFVHAELGAQLYPKAPEANHNPSPRDFRVLWFENRQDEAEWIAHRIRHLLGTKFVEANGTERGLSPGDFAILMRSADKPEGQSGTQRHTAFTDALTNVGVEFNLQSAGSIFSRPHARVIQETLELLRHDTPDRDQVRAHLEADVWPVFPEAKFGRVVEVLSRWGRNIHRPSSGSRVRLYPQQFLHEILHAFEIKRSLLPPQAMRDLGVLSQVLQDVESVYLSIDSAGRYRSVLNFVNNLVGAGYDSGIREIASRPDEVTVSTVHKMKGLEFPVVFVADVEQGRFPTNRSSYRGWLPSECIQAAVDRGAHHGTREGEIRLFYTAITRAERYLYVTGCEQLPGGRKRWRESDFSRRLLHPEISDDSVGLPDGLEPAQAVARIEEPVVPTSFTEIRQYLCCPQQYRFSRLYGFSPPIKEMFGFGRTVHTAVSALHLQFDSGAPSPDEARDLAQSVFHLKHVAPSRDPEVRPGPYERAKERSGQILSDYVDSFELDFGQRRQVEMRFEVPVEQAVITGSIDLLLREDERGQVLDARVIDFKAIDGGANPSEDPTLHWTELSLQVQLYAHAAHEVVNEHARTGHVHLLKGNSRIDVPVEPEALEAALGNVKWAVDRVLDDDFPMRPHTTKCEACDFRLLCPALAEPFKVDTRPPPIHVPNRAPRLARAFSEFQQEKT